MTRMTPSNELITEVLCRIPEGLIRHDILCQRILLERSTMDQFLGGRVARDGDWWYDTSRISLAQLATNRNWARPVFPDIDSKLMFQDKPIEHRKAQRFESLQSLPDAENARAALQQLEDAAGFINRSELILDEQHLQLMIKAGYLRQEKDWVYDPLRLGQRSLNKLTYEHQLAPLRDDLTRYLQSREGQTAPQSEVIQQFGSQVVADMLSSSGLRLFQVGGGHKRKYVAWVRLNSVTSEVALRAANASIGGAWEDLQNKCGDVLRPDAKDGKTSRLRVIARTYTLQMAARRLGIRPPSLEKAISEDRIQAFEDPEGVTRIPADAVEAAYHNPEYAEHITAFETVPINDLALVLASSYNTVRRQLQRVGIRTPEAPWNMIRGRWELPDTYLEFRTQLKEMQEERRVQRDEQRREESHLNAEEYRAERERRDALRAKLVAAFPAWQHEGRADQEIILHVGPPNSGKTYDAIQALIAAGSGWYLAPLRLLAFEIFDRLNQMGVPCNLLTGEEHIPIPGAEITAATVEMFSRHLSGECVIIDEAQMLADADRGWAWTRALMEADSAEIHVIGPHTVQGLIEQMASAAALPLRVVEHERLAPIQIAEKSWPLHDLPSRTILVAFSRAMVLDLKTELERMKRTVSVVYGNLPPEVRRKQADRFANGETEICVATDAVGMGLNLPCDYVCFYEVEKYDGRQNRLLYPSEVQQIGGRAGRYGLSTIGEVGATSKRNLRLLRQLFYEPAQVLTHARVAPTVEDLELIPGTLASKLTQWAQLESIPESLQGAIQTADMSERIELASMLTEREVKLLGLEAALKLVNAPTRQNTRGYWYQCARHILTDKNITLPPVAPREINDTIELESIEYCVACADIYLWLSQRKEFTSFAPEEPLVRQMRADWSVRIDEALLRRISALKRCARCGKSLPLKHRFSICDSCFHGRTPFHDEELDELA
jgi:hypothetical protein